MELDGLSFCYQTSYEVIDNCLYYNNGNTDDYCNECKAGY